MSDSLSHEEKIFIKDLLLSVIKGIEILMKIPNTILINRQLELAIIRRNKLIKMLKTGIVEQIY